MPRFKRAFAYFLSKKALDIDGVGEKVAELLIDEGLVQAFDDLFTLEEGDFLSLEGFAELSAKNAVDAIRAVAKDVPLARLLTGLGIDHVGEETARDLAAHFGAIETLRRATLEELQSINGIGDVVAKSLVEWFSKAKNSEMLDRLLLHITIAKPEKKIANQKLSGKTFVFTGGMEHMTRDEGEDTVRLLGGSVVGSVSKKTSYVVAGSDAGSKLDKARALGVTILTEDEFLHIVQA